MKLLLENWRKYLTEQVEVHPESKIFCDMDGVLVDFAGSTVELINNLLDGGDIPWGAGKSKGYLKRIRKIQNSLGPEWRVSGPEDLDLRDVRNFMFSLIGTNPGAFYFGLSPLDDGVGQLWQELKATGREVYILSAAVPARREGTMTSEQGKVEWVKKHGLDPVKTIVVQGDQEMSTADRKAVYAKTNGISNILIDDKQENIDNWEEAEGLGLLHEPRGSEATIQTLRGWLDETST